MSKRKRVPPSAVLDAIAFELDGKQWTPDTLEEIARILRANGYTIRDVEDTE